MNQKTIHFIAVGGAVMHNLAIVLRRKGYKVTGSDDKITDPARSNLQKEGILPANTGFFEENINPDIDAVILGMHARADNPELLKAQQLGLKIYSFPEYLYEVSKDKKRVVIAGSHGKTTITSMIMHVLKENGLNFDYMVGAKVKGFDTGVKISEDAPLIILEGDEYLASPINPESKFMYYHPHLALISGIAWDHINVFPDYNGYVKQFEKFAQSVEDGGYLTWFEEDEELKKIFSEDTRHLPRRPAGKAQDTRQEAQDIESEISELTGAQFPLSDSIRAGVSERGLGGEERQVRRVPYSIHPYFIRGNTTYLLTTIGEVALKVFGEHNLQNISGAKNICIELGVKEDPFYRAISSFEGAANRLQFVGKNNHTVIYKDFAHSPSKLKATVHAMKSQYETKKLVTVMELHTFSSLNKDFLEQYKGTMNDADIPVVFYDRETFVHKKMPVLGEKFVKDSFGNGGLNIFTDSNSLQQFLLSQDWADKNLLLMSSGNYAGMNIEELSNSILKQ